MALAPSRLATPHPQDGPDRPARGSAPRGPTPEGFAPWPDPARRFRSSARGPTPTPCPNAKQSNRRTLHLLTHLLAGESAPAKREAIQEAAVMENNTETRSTHDPGYTIMQQGKSHGRYR